ncbi:MAG: primosomal protein N' [Prevotellaceae bacterium]|nr:primosomal protein N' [Prevotellaceae bacterium]
MKFIDIILPLPLDGLFTYSVPDSMHDKIETGKRVLVPFGKSKTYIGLIIKEHDIKPEFAVKDILMVIDDAPIANDTQLKLWKWIADYYMSPIGEVYNAALPGGLKNIDSYKPKTETYVTLTPQYRNEQSLHIALDALKRADKQRDLLTEYLRLSHWDTIEGTVCRETPVEITRDELLNSAHCATAVFRSLITRKILMTYECEVGRLNNAGEAHLDNIKKLNEVQQEAYNQIMFNFLKKNVVLLHGVTSSGKTEIYIHLIRQALEKHKQVLYLLPEIALTVQIRQRLQKVFGNRLGIYHSKYSDAERVEIWKKQLSANPYDVILGARSATLLPFTNLGLVIIDEEHETSFKQQDPAPRYHARSAAIMLAAMFGAKTLLGSATPSLESYYNAQKGKYGFVELNKRYNDIQLPEIQVVDIKDLQHRKMMNGPFSPILLSAIRKALDNNEQAILFQNRRGFAPMIECKECGWVPHCDACDVSLTYHKNLNQLTCHYCGNTYTLPETCPCCGSRNLISRGYGTEKIEDKIIELFPDANVARMDLDTTRTRNAYERIINDFSAHRTNILIGTQMVSKGLDFDRVSVVGILNADNMLNYPDFRAYEHAFMMMAQVSGRAGRKGKQGLVLLQTKSAQLPVISQVVRNDCKSFYSDLLEERQLFHYPPFYHIVNVYLKNRDNVTVEIAARDMGNILRSWFGERVLGPDKPSISRIKSLHIRKIVLKLENGIDLSKVRAYLKKAQETMIQAKRYGALQIYFDVDPL